MAVALAYSRDAPLTSKTAKTFRMGPWTPPPRVCWHFTHTLLDPCTSSCTSMACWLAGHSDSCTLGSALGQSPSDQQIKHRTVTHGPATAKQKWTSECLPRSAMWLQTPEVCSMNITASTWLVVEPSIRSRMVSAPGAYENICKQQPSLPLPSNP